VKRRRPVPVPPHDYTPSGTGPTRRTDPCGHPRCPGLLQANAVHHRAPVDNPTRDLTEPVHPREEQP
jgi:hypothetical protein